MKIKKENKVKQEINDDANYTLTMTGQQFRTLLHDLERVEQNDRIRSHYGDVLKELLEKAGFKLYFEEEDETIQ